MIPELEMDNELKELVEQGLVRSTLKFVEEERDADFPDWFTIQLEEFGVNKTFLMYASMVERGDLSADEAYDAYMNYAQMCAV